MHFNVALAYLATGAAALPTLNDLFARQTPGQGYVVSLADNVLADSIIAKVPGLKSFVTQQYTLINAFSLSSGASGLVTALGLIPGVTVEKDQIYTVNAVQTQTNAPWGLQRVSTKAKVQSTSGGTESQPAYRYTFDNTTLGQNVDVYVVDTGINCNHVSFGGRAVCRTQADFTGSGSSFDGNGHGTHCAGTIGSSSYGVAKRTNLFAVRVLGSDGSGSSSNIISGIQYVVNQKKARNLPTVMSMSLGGSKQTALTNAVNAAIQQGVHAVVAAGNSAADACLSSPSDSNAVVIGATNITDTFAYFSNFGKCVTALAPGFNVLSAWIGSNTATNVISGTSMATPHTAGTIAHYLSNSTLRAYSPATMKSFIVSTGQKNVITKVPANTPNVIVQTR